MQHAVSNVDASREKDKRWLSWLSKLRCVCWRDDLDQLQHMSSIWTPRGSNERYNRGGRRENREGRGQAKITINDFFAVGEAEVGST